MMPIQIMAHLVMGYPCREATLASAQALADSGIEILELQIPFSDPTADGPVLTQACEISLRGGFRMSHAEEYISSARDLGFKEVHVMSYANIPFRFGLEAYLARMKQLGVTGVIVPDMPLEDDDGFYTLSRGIGIDALAVAVPTMSRERIQLLKEFQPNRVYAALREGVTGRGTGITEGAQQFLLSLDIPMVYAGFGINSSQQVADLSGYAYAAVIGSHITRAVGSGPDWYNQVKRAVKECIPRE